MALNLQSLSITSVFNSIVNFFRSQENNSRWKDLTTGSEGSFLIRLLSNVFSAISYRIVAQSRENYLSTAALPSSCTGIAVNLGYSVFRGSNLKRKVELAPNGNYTFPKLSVIGTYSTDYDIITLEDLDLHPVENNEPLPVFDVVVGKVREETFTTGTDAIKIFSLFTTGISEDYVLYLDSKEVPTTNVIKKMTEDKYLVRTNPFSSVDIAYLNTFPEFQYPYGTGSEITIRYVELADVPVNPFTSDMFPYGELSNVSNISGFLPFESVDSIKVTAPLHHETQNLIRSKADYANRLREIVPTTIDTNWEALTPTYTLISYLKSDNTLLSSSEVEKVTDLLKEERFFGTPLPDITYPRREVAYLQVDLELSNKYKNISDVDLDVSNIIENSYNRELGVSFNTYDLERKIENLSYVRYARVSHVINEREPNKNYQLGYILGYNDNYYIASKILGVSGSTAPDWATKTTKEIDTGLETTDGSLIWRAYKRLPGVDAVQWLPNSPYGIGDYVYVDAAQYSKFMFKCVDLVKSTGATAPDVSYAELGDFIVDGNIVWAVKDYSETYSVRQSLHSYRLGKSVNLPTLAGYSLECVSYTGTTGTDETLEFEENTYPILYQTTNTFVIEGDKTQYFRADDVISAAYAGGYTTFAVESSEISGLNTVVTVRQQIDESITYTDLITQPKGTKDGQILWSLIDNIDEITYDWNAYVTFSHKLNIIGK